MDTPAKELYDCTLIGCSLTFHLQRLLARFVAPARYQSELEADLSSRLAERIEEAQGALRRAGCTPLATVRAAAGVMDMIFLNAYGARLLVRCSMRKACTADLKALVSMHQQRSFDHIVLLTEQAQPDDGAPSIVSFSELPVTAATIAKLQPGWAI